MRKINVNDFRRATRSTAKDVNRRILLTLLHEHGALSRADLARHLRMSRGTITALVSELLYEGKIVEGDAVEIPRGRKPKLLRIRTEDRLVVAVDIRFGHTRLMLSDFSGAPIAMESFRTLTSPDELVAELASRIDASLHAHRRRGRCEGIGLVVPGMVEQDTGRVLNAPQLGWREVNIRDALQEATGHPVFIENAARAAALAQLWLGQESHRHGGDFVYISIFEGVGAGVAVNGQVVRGHCHLAGELGHVIIDPAGPACMCGSRGCLEAHTSNLATLARYLGMRMGSEEIASRLTETELTIAELIARAREGDERAHAALEETGHFLGYGVCLTVHALNPARIYIAGDIAAAWDIIEPPLRAVLQAHALTPAAAATPVVPDREPYPRLRGAMALLLARDLAAPQIA